MYSEIIILTENIDLLRYFYRNTVGLKEIIVDSNDYVEFQLSASTSLILEKCSLPYPEHASSACRFAIKTDNFDEIKRHMENDRTPLTENFTHSGKYSLRGSDPDGNIFVLYPPDSDQ